LTELAATGWPSKMITLAWTSQVRIGSLAAASTRVTAPMTVPLRSMRSLRLDRRGTASLAAIWSSLSANRCNRVWRSWLDSDPSNSIHRRIAGLGHNRPVLVLAVKALLAPTFVVGASVTARRFGPWVGGVVGGLPVVAGPILLAYALEHGRTFAGQAAAGTLLGLLSLTAFVVVYGRLASRFPWFVCMIFGWAAFALVTVVLDGVTVAAGVALGLVCLGFAGGLLLLPGLPATASGGAILPTPTWDLPVRAGCALGLVLALTTTAGWLGPQLSGLLAPFPVITTVLATFTHSQRGPDAGCSPASSRSRSSASRWPSRSTGRPSLLRSRSRRPRRWPPRR
jgi:hypothetical protein